MKLAWKRICPEPSKTDWYYVHGFCKPKPSFLKFLSPASKLLDGDLPDTKNTCTIVPLVKIWATAGSLSTFRVYS
jgi:hypothetical protein